MSPVDPYRQFVTLMYEFEVYLLTCCLWLESLQDIFCEIDDVGLAHLHYHLSLVNLPEVKNLVYKMQNSLCVAFHDLIYRLAVRVAVLAYEL